MTNEMTQGGLEKLKIQLARVRDRLKAVAHRIREAKDLGDLSENADYQVAKEEQSLLMTRVAQLEQRIRMAKIADNLHNGIITVGCRVEVENGFGKFNFEIVGPEEVDALAGRISPDSAIGAALYGHRRGEVITVSTPKGVSEYKILNVA